MPNNKITKPRNAKEAEKMILQSGIGFDDKYILAKAVEEIKSLRNKKEVGPETFLYKSLTIFEFDKGVLLVSCVPERFRVFVLQFSKNLQTEYGCTTPSEKSLAEAAAFNFVRILSIQDKISSYLNIGSVSETGIKYLAVLSKELDRAERHYLISLQALKVSKMPSLEVNIKTNTAVVGQNQMVQANNS